MPIIKKQKNVRVAIIGCGWFGNYHLDNLLKFDNVDIVALYNRSVDKLEKTGEKVPKARLYQDLNKMFAKENIHAVIVCLTPDSHGEIEEICCKKGIHMFIEKPVELSLDKALKISEEIKLSNIITSVGYHERYNPVLDVVKELVEKEPTGIVNVYWLGVMLETEWWRDKEISGGQLLEQTTHLVDMIRYIFGEAESVFMSGKRNPKFEGLEHTIEDYSSGIINMKSGVIATVQSACYIEDPTTRKIGMEIVMPRCRIEYKWADKLTIIANGEEKSVDMKEDKHIPCLQTFIDAVRTGDRYLIKSTYEDAVKTLELTVKANKSMETGDIIKI